MLRSVCRVQRVCCAGSSLQCGVGAGAGRQQKASGWKKGKTRGPSAAEENQRTNLYDLYLRCVEPPPREVYVGAVQLLYDAVLLAHPPCLLPGAAARCVLTRVVRRVQRAAVGRGAGAGRTAREAVHTYDVEAQQAA